MSDSSERNNGFCRVPSENHTVMKMKITERDVEKIAYLARLEFDETEKQNLAREFDAIVAFAGAVAQAQTPAAENKAAGEPVSPVPLRADVPERLFFRDALLAAAPSCADGFIVVPRVVKEEDDGA